MKFSIALLIFLMSVSAQAKEDSIRRSSWWIMYKMGSAISDVSGLQPWAASEGLTGISRSSRNYLFGFDILHNRNRMVYGISSDFELRTFGQTEPYFFSFTLRAGYTIIDQNLFQVKGLAGIGVGYAFLRFENGTPTSLQNLSTNYSDPYARANAFIGRCEVIASYSFSQTKRKNHGFLFRPVLFANAGFQPVLKHGTWHYGEPEMENIDGDRFVGQPINMPKFYKGNWFATVGIAISIANRN
jgi:hypothetical protein